MNRAESSVAVQTEPARRPQERAGAQRDAAATGNAPWILGILSLVAIVPYWTARYLVMIDYPNHLARWFVLFHMNDGAYRFPDMYAPAWGFLPYISVDVLGVA